MRRLLLPALAVALLGTAAFTGPSGCTTAVDKPVLGQTLVDDKALYVAEAAMYGADLAAGDAARAGLIVPGSPTAVKVAGILGRAHTYLVAARAAYKVGDAATMAAKISTFQQLVSTVWPLIPKKA